LARSAHLIEASHWPMRGFAQELRLVSRFALDLVHGIHKGV
jgi:hypothetical protein